MVYSTEASKWRAYQFSDPFATGSFVVCNKIDTRFCRPDCDAHPITELRSEIKFVDLAADAVRLGYTLCDLCNPAQAPSINVNLLLKTVKAINASIGFVHPLLDDDEDKVQETIKENIIGHDQRRLSLPSNAYSKNTKAVAYSMTKNDSEHYRLIDLACRHLALAAANSIFSEPLSANSPTSLGGSPKEEAASKKKSGRKRRGGVLGFKELATKSKLSAWHFHRVFKSIIGLTPKTYGDMCWEYLEKERDQMSPLFKPAASAGSEESGSEALRPLSLSDHEDRPLPEDFGAVQKPILAATPKQTRPSPASAQQLSIPTPAGGPATGARPKHAPSAKSSKKGGAEPAAGKKRSAAQFEGEPEPKRLDVGLFDDVLLALDMSDNKVFDFGSRATSEPNLAAVCGLVGFRPQFTMPSSNPLPGPYSLDVNPSRNFATYEMGAPAYESGRAQSGTSHNSPEMSSPGVRFEASPPDLCLDLAQPQYPVAQVAPHMTMNQDGYQLPSFALDNDFPAVDISPMTVTTEPSLDIGTLGLELDDSMSLYFNPQVDLGVLDNYMAPDNVPEMAAYDDKKPFDLTGDPMMAGINDMLMASGY